MGRRKPRQPAQLLRAIEDEAYNQKARARHRGKTDVRGEDDCWPWQGYQDANGYGQMAYNGRSYKAHRLAWILNMGELEEGEVVRHSCDDPSCQNWVKHLQPGTTSQNMRDMYSRGRAGKLNEDAVRDIRTSEESPEALAERHGVTVRHVYTVRAGRVWSWVEETA